MIFRNGDCSNLQEWRLLEMNGKRLAQRAVEDGISGLVCEIGEHHNIFVGEGPRPEIG